MASKREYLIGLGLAKPGRGKFSREGNDAITKAIAGGMVFDDAVKAPPVKRDKPVEAKVVSEDDGGIHFSNELRYAGKEWRGELNGKKITVSDRAACMTCGYSLIAHVCSNPVALHGNDIIKGLVAR